MATAVQVESLWNGLTDNSGQPLGAGKVYTYSAGTTTPVSLFTASDKSTSATNPIILDGNGKAQVWADGRYKFVVKTSADVTLYTLDNLLYGFDDTTVLYGGTSTGAANAQVVSVPATVTSYANGQTISFIAGFTNTGATTLQFNSLSAVNLVKGPTPSSLQAGDLIAGQMYTATYHGGAFRLTDYPTVADVQQSRLALAGSVAGTNTITANLSPAPSAYEAGQVVRLKAANSPTGPATLNLNNLGAKAVQFNNAALVNGEIGQNLYHEAVYDGTQFQLLNPATGWIPAGSVIATAAASAPNGWLLCAGQAVSRTAYAVLFAAIGTSYGVGDGTTTFNLPDLRGRAVAGLDNMNGTDAGRLDWANTIGTTGGAQTHTLTTAEMPSHTHTQDPHTHTQNAHSHTFNVHSDETRLPGFVAAGANAGWGAATTSSVAATNQNTTATNQNTGGGGAHNNMQPTILLNYIIKH